MRRGGRGEERDTTTHLIKIQVFTHGSRVTIFSTFMFKMEQKILEFRLIQSDDKAFCGSEIILKLTEVQRTNLKLFVEP